MLLSPPLYVHAVLGANKLYVFIEAPFPKSLHTHFDVLPPYSPFCSIHFPSLLPRTSSN